MPTWAESGEQAGREQTAQGAYQTEPEHQCQKIARSGAMGDEELRATAHNIEDGLCDGNAPEADEVERFEPGSSGGVT